MHEQDLCVEEPIDQQEGLKRVYTAGQEDAFAVQPAAQYSLPPALSPRGVPSQLAYCQKDSLK